MMPPEIHDTIKRLHWGCGDDRPDGWINSDRKAGPGIQLTCDILAEPFPLPADSIDYAVSVHALQEIHPENLVAVLAELRRVLKPSGALRLILPDALKGFLAYQRGDRDYFAVPDEDASSLGGKLALQLTWYGYSRSLFTPDSIEELLLRAGFSRVDHCAHRVTQSLHPAIVELDNRENESLFVEAVK